MRTRQSHPGLTVRDLRSFLNDGALPTGNTEKLYVKIRSRLFEVVKLTRNAHARDVVFELRGS